MFSSFRRHAGPVIVLIVICLLVLTLPVLASPSEPAKFQAPNATLTVTNTNDSGPGSLRDTIDSASSGDIILFDPALAEQTITLTNGEIVVNKSLIIYGPESARITLRGNNTSRIFRAIGGALNLYNLALTQGQATGDGGAIYAIDLALSNVSIMSNTASGSGGGLYARDSIQIVNTQILSNTATNDGGGIYAGGIYYLADSLIQGNRSANGGGGIYTSNELVMINTNLLSNTARTGGGAYVLRADLTGGLIQGNTGGGLVTTDLVISDTQFINNTTEGAGGGAYTYRAYLSGGIFQNNHCEGPFWCSGGALYALEEVVMTDTQFISNTATYFGGAAAFLGNTYLTGVVFDHNHCASTSCCGGAMYLYGPNTMLTNTLLANNESDSRGGGICNWNSSTTLISSTLRNNAASDEGGGIYNNAWLTVDHDTLNGNTTGSDGGGIYSRGSLIITQSTLSDNSAGMRGGGIYSGQDLNTDYSTFTGNAANDGGGIYIGYDYYGTVNLHRSLIAGNAATDSGSEIYNSGTVTAADYNVIGYGGSPRSFGFTPSGTDIVPVGALNTVLNPTLQNNGGPNFTHALVSGSPAMDAVPIDGSHCNPPVTIDQRGAVRANGAYRGGTACDSGAYEYDSAQTPTVVSLLALTANSTTGSDGWLVATCLAILSSVILIRRQRS